MDIFVMTVLLYYLFLIETVVGSLVWCNECCLLYYLVLLATVVEEGYCYNDCAHLYHLELFVTFAGSWVLL